MPTLETFAAAAVTLFSGALLVIAVLAYRRSREQGLLFVAAAFALFVLKGLLLASSVFVGTPPLDAYAGIGGLADVVILGLLYGMTLRR
jgi:hypothetical protein